MVLACLIRSLFGALASDVIEAVTFKLLEKRYHRELYKYNLAIKNGGVVVT